MSISKAYCSKQENQDLVLREYLSEAKPTIRDLAQQLGTFHQNIMYILKQRLTPEEYHAEKVLRYSRSKSGTKNPMKDKNGSLHHNYVGVIGDGHGYLQMKVGTKYVLAHRHVMAQALGLSKLPMGWEVHHINEDKHDNRLDNLALVTNSGHSSLHRIHPRSYRSPLWDQWESGISKLKEITPI